MHRASHRHEVNRHSRDAPPYIYHVLDNNRDRLAIIRKYSTYQFQPPVLFRRRYPPRAGISWRRPISMLRRNPGPSSPLPSYLQHSRPWRASVSARALALARGHGGRWRGRAHREHAKSCHSGSKRGAPALLRAHDGSQRP